MKPATRDVIGITFTAAAMYSLGFYSGWKAVDLPPCPPPTAIVTLATNGVRVTIGAEMFIVRFAAPVQLDGGRAEWTDGWAQLDTTGPAIGDGLRWALNGTP